MNEMAQFTPKGRNPFAPGAGLTPPLLAGRDDELDFFKSGLEDMKAFRRGLAAVMYAPRGMGKTVLMERLRDEIAVADADAAFVLTRPDEDDEIPMFDLEQLLPADAPTPSQTTLKKEGGLNAGVRAGISTTETWSRSGKERRGLFEMRLKEACKSRAAVLVIDEAHRLKDGDRVVLLKMAQEVTKRGRFLFILTGTPSLTRSISAEATFADRFKKISLKMLTESAAMAALQTPLEYGGIAIEAGALRYVVAQANCYPFFLQLWGEALWDCAWHPSFNRGTCAGSEGRCGRRAGGLLRRSIHGNQQKRRAPHCRHRGRGRL